MFVNTIRPPHFQKIRLIGSGLSGLGIRKHSFCKHQRWIVYCLFFMLRRRCMALITPYVAMLQRGFLRGAFARAHLPGHYHKIPEVRKDQGRAERDVLQSKM